MSITVSGGTTYAAVPRTGVFDTGETLGVTVYLDGAEAVARDATGCVEDVAGSGVYTVTGTAPSAQGLYTVVVDDTVFYWADYLTVTPAVIPGTVVSGSITVSAAGSVDLLDATVIPSPETLLKVSGVLAVVATGSVDLATNRGGSSTSRRPSVDATYLREFPIHRNLGRIGKP